MAAVTKEDKNNKSASPLNCCQSNDSLTSTSSDQDDSINICEAMNNFVISPKRKHSENSKIKKCFPKRPPVDLKFDNIVYNAAQWKYKNGFHREQKQILHGVSGVFKSGELTAIMGPSGAGKSTLLNGLAGYIFRGFEGTVMFNDEERDESPRFNKLVAYIPQDEELRLPLTVMENMMIAADLKMGYTLSTDYKVTQVKEILEVLGLQNSHNTMTSSLSGGQRKRLAIALELLSNTPIIFLDEPTTGLDSLSCSQCVALLKKLARDGRTVICTIHQPSALLFEMFDHLYVLAEGHCIYDGAVNNLLPQLAQIGLECPPFHNPADFLMEVAIGEYGTDVKDLANLQKKCSEKQAQSLPVEENLTEKELFVRNMTRMTQSIEDIVYYTTPKPANSLMQFLLLYKRNLIMSKRCYKLFLNRIIAHIAVGLLFGYLYANVGTSASTLLANYVFLYGSMLLLVYTGQMAVTLSFPLEIKVLKREHFNRWFRLGPYLISVLLIEIPFQIACSWVYILISYHLTGQLADYRFYFFVIFCSLGTLCAQSWGYFIGANCPISAAVFIGPVLACLFSVFGFCITLMDTPYLFRWLYHISYFRASFHGLAYAVYGLPRGPLDCPEDMIYCHYQDPMKFLDEWGIDGMNLWSNISLIVGITFIMHTSTYVSLWCKLNRR